MSRLESGLWQKMRVTNKGRSVVNWRLGSDAPKEPCRMLVVYNGIVFPALYENKVVTRFPDDLVKLLLSNCEWWADYPDPPKDTEKDT